MLTGKPLSISLYNSLLQDSDFKTYADKKLVLVTVSFLESDVKTGRILGQRWSYHPYIPVDNNTTALDYWNKISHNVKDRFVNNLYDNRIPLILGVRVLNVDRFANSVITERKDGKTGKRTFTVTKKSPFQTGGEETL